jgi:hypothetical protein
MATSFRRLIQRATRIRRKLDRVIVGGVPVPPGKMLLERRGWLGRYDDDLRRMLNFEPRGHGMMCSVLVNAADRPRDRHIDYHHGGGRVCADVRPLPHRRGAHARGERDEACHRADDAASHHGGRAVGKLDTKLLQWRVA